MNKPQIDLHVHSTESDGTFSPQEVLYAAKDAGLLAFALTDHDTCAGIAKINDLAKSENIELIPGIELSTSYEEKEIHIVGLYIDPKNPLLLQKTADFQNCRSQRNELIIEALQKEGFAITMQELVAENKDSVITRANIARYLYQHGYIKSIQEAFDKYIGDGCRCYINRFKVSAPEAVSLIKQAGGIAILAHPLLYHFSTARLQKLIDVLKEAGLDGIEAIYSSHSSSDERFLKKLAVQNELLISGGSDFHGENKPKIKIGTGNGNLAIPYSILDTIKEKHFAHLTK